MNILPPSGEGEVMRTHISCTPWIISATIMPEDIVVHCDDRKGCCSTYIGCSTCLVIPDPCSHFTLVSTSRSIVLFRTHDSGLQSRNEMHRWTISACRLNFPNRSSHFETDSKLPLIVDNDIPAICVESDEQLSSTWFEHLWRERAFLHEWIYGSGLENVIWYGYCFVIYLVLSAEVGNWTQMKKS